MTIAVRRRLFTRDEYARLVDAGILGEDDRVELIEGEIVEMAPIGPLHADSAGDFADVLVAALGTRAKVRQQYPVALDEYLEPQPDIAVVLRKSYRHSHPSPADILLIIEAADSSLEFDQVTKARLYAGHGIPDYWIMNLAQNTVEVHRDPGPERYHDVRVYRRGQTIAPLAFPNLSFSVDQILG